MITPIPTHKVIIGLLLTLVLQLTAALPVMAADAPELRRLRAGLDLFPSFLAADTAIASKVAPTDGKLHIALIYDSNQRLAIQEAARLQKVGQIRHLPIIVDIMRPTALLANSTPLAGIFITQPQLAQLTKIVHYGKAHSIITFSPFIGDVALGVSGGISVTARILPKVNIPTLKASGLRIKPFFLRVASLYE